MLFLIVVGLLPLLLVLSSFAMLAWRETALAQPWKAMWAVSVPVILFVCMFINMRFVDNYAPWLWDWFNAGEGSASIRQLLAGFLLALPLPLLVLYAVHGTLRLLDRSSDPVGGTGLKGILAGDPVENRFIAGVAIALYLFSHLVLGLSLTQSIWMMGVLLILGGLVCWFLLSRIGRSSAGSSTVEEAFAGVALEIRADLLWHTDVLEVKAGWAQGKGPVLLVFCNDEKTCREIAADGTLAKVRDRFVQRVLQNPVLRGRGGELRPEACIQLLHPPAEKPAEG